MPIAAKRWSAVAVVGLLLRLVLGALFVVAGVLKLRDPTKFALEIGNYQLIHAGTGVLAALLPPVEIVAGLAVIVLPRLWRQAAALLITLLVVVFSVAVGFAYFKGINIDCGCFGGAEGPITAWTLVRNASLFLTAATIFFIEAKPRRA